MRKSPPDAIRLAGDPAPAVKAGLLGRFRRPVRRTPSGRRDETRSDVMVAGIGIALGLTCALFPWYIFFNQEQFGIRALTFEGGGTVTGTGGLSALPERVGAPMDLEELPIMELDLFATGTLPDPDETMRAPGIAEQPFPADLVPFSLVHVANGRAMLEDDQGLFVVQPGSTLPDSSKVSSIEQRDGRWVIVTSSERVIEMAR